jgi:glycosyltransferase involved in cell wall biosynthesis
MRLVLDLQAAQSPSRSDEIARYTIGFARAIAEAASAHELLLVLNGRFAETIEKLSAEFANSVPKGNIRVFEVPGPLAEIDPANIWRARSAELLHQSFLADLHPDIVHTAVSFDGWQNDIVTSIGPQVENLPAALTLLDPALLAEPSTEEPGIALFRQRRVQLIKSADLLFTASEATRQQAMTALHLRADRVVQIPPSAETINLDEPPVVTQPQDQPGLSRSFIVLASQNGDLAKESLAAIALLPPDLRKSHQVVFAGELGKAVRAKRLSAGRDLSITDHEIVIAESEETLNRLYGSAALVVFPAPNEQIGLSVLDAMAKSAAVIGSNQGATRELIQKEDALFNPREPAGLAAKITSILRDPNLQQTMRKWSSQRAKKFSWQAQAEKSLIAFQEIHDRRNPKQSARSVRKPLLALVSPFPPERTGIADYAARLAPCLAEHYEVVCVANQSQIDDPLLRSRFPIRDLRWFERHGRRFERILYQFGNSPAHKKMFNLLEQYPGVAVLHDFFLSDVLCWMQSSGYAPGCFSKALYDSHGLSGLWQDHRDGRIKSVNSFPCNAAVLRDSTGIIVHSSHSIDLARKWYGESVTALMRRVPFLPRKQEKGNLSEARARLQIPEDAFVVCSYGWITPFKLCDAILRAWLASQLAQSEKCYLVFVGATSDGEYGKSFSRKVEALTSRSPIRITGYVDEQQFRAYLDAADLALQLRTQSRGETSATIFDCLAQGLPLIVNAHGSAAELPEGVVVKIDDEFADEVLVEALTSLHANPERRREISARTASYLEEEHQSKSIAQQYCDFIEEVNLTSPRAREQRVLETIARTFNPIIPSSSDFGAVALALSANRPPFGWPQILLDITNITKLDLRTGIERVTRGVLMSLVSNPPPGYRIEPVRAVAGGYVYARRFMAETLHFAQNDLADDPVECNSGDLFLGVDWPADVLPSLKPWFRKQQGRGMRNIFVVYDLLPLLRPDLFPPELQPMTFAWLKAVSEIGDGAVCISRTVADELHQWLQETKPDRLKPLPIGFFQLGADLHASLPTKGLPDKALQILARIRGRPTFLIVGTVEPRKGHRQALAAIELLWKERIDLNLVIVGKKGWMMEDFAQRIQQHSEREKRLFWFQGISDEMLEQIYRSSRALLVTSEGEGFGLPLIEAAQYGIPIVARDLPVFREVAAAHAYYFSGRDPAALANALREWLTLGDRTPVSTGLRWSTWLDSTQEFLNVVLREQWYRSWAP